MFNIPIVLDVLPSPDYVTAGGLCKKELRFSTGSRTDSINIKLKRNLKPESTLYSLSASPPASELFSCSVVLLYSNALTAYTHPTHPSVFTLVFLS